MDDTRIVDPAVAMPTDIGGLMESQEGSVVPAPDTTDTRNDAAGRLAESFGVPAKIAAVCVAMMEGALQDDALGMGGCSVIEFQTEIAINPSAMRLYQMVIKNNGLRSFHALGKLAKMIQGAPRVSEGDKLAIRIYTEQAKMAVPEILGQYASNERKKRAYETQVSLSESEERGDQNSPKHKNFVPQTPAEELPELTGGAEVILGKGLDK